MHRHIPSPRQASRHSSSMGGKACKAACCACNSDANIPNGPDGPEKPTVEKEELVGIKQLQADIPPTVVLKASDLPAVQKREPPTFNPPPKELAPKEIPKETPKVPPPPEVPAYVPITSLAQLNGCWMQVKGGIGHSRCQMQNGTIKWRLGDKSSREVSKKISEVERKR